MTFAVPYLPLPGHHHPVSCHRLGDRWDDGGINDYRTKTSEKEFQDIEDWNTKYDNDNQINDNQINDNKYNKETEC